MFSYVCNVNYIPFSLGMALNDHAHQLGWWRRRKRDTDQTHSWASRFSQRWKFKSDDYDDGDIDLNLMMIMINEIIRLWQDKQIPCIHIRVAHNDDGRGNLGSEKIQKILQGFISDHKKWQDRCWFPLIRRLECPYQLNTFSMVDL